MNLKGIMLSKISQSEKDTNAVRYYLSVKSQKKKKKNTRVPEYSKTETESQVQRKN